MVLCITATGAVSVASANDLPAWYQQVNRVMLPQAAAIRALVACPNPTIASPKTGFPCVEERALDLADIWSAAIVKTAAAARTGPCRPELLRMNGASVQARRSVRTLVLRPGSSAAARIGQSTAVIEAGTRVVNRWDGVVRCLAR